MSAASSRSQLEIFDDSMYGSGEDLSHLPQHSPNQSPGKGANNSPDAFASQLSRLQEEHVMYTKRIEKEKRRKDMLDTSMDNVRHMLREIQDKTNNGNITKTNDMNNKKLIARLEYQLQTSKVKLSTAKNDNMTYKGRIEDLRREKILQLQILNDLNKEAVAARKRSKYCAKEVQQCNEKKHKVKMLISNIKQKMLKDMEDFSREIDKAKATITSTQTNIMNTIREKLNLTVDASPAPGSPGTRGMSPFKGTSSMFPTMFAMTAPSTTAAPAPAVQTENSEPATPQEVEALLKDTDVKTVRDLFVALQQSEDSIFTLYHETQQRHEEVDKMELENKNLEAKVEEQMKRLHVLEGNQETVKVELEQHIQQLNTQMAKFDNDYAVNLEVLDTVKEPIMSVLKNVAVDEEALDQQLLSTGITDRNVLDFLAIIEQRIDDLIQMAKAANHQPIRRDDFMRAAALQKEGLLAPQLPSMDVTNDEEDDMLYNEDNNKGFSVQPLNIAVLKDLIMKKLQQKASQPNGGRVAINMGNHRHGSYASSQMSTTSISNNGMKPSHSGSSLNSDALANSHR